MLCLLYQAIWLFHGITNGRIIQFGNGRGKGYRTIENVKIQYIVNGAEYNEMFLRGGLKDKNEIINIKYLLFAPEYSRINNVIGNWAMVLVVTLIVFFSISIIFLTKELIPPKSTFVLSTSYPFLWMDKENKKV